MSETEMLTAYRAEVVSLLEMNERMGAALAFIYRQYPHVQDEVFTYLADYPFMFAQYDGADVEIQPNVTTDESHIGP